MELLDFELAGIFLGDSGMEALSRGIAGQAVLRVLNLDLRKIGCTCRGCEHLGRALAAGPACGLQKLKLLMGDNVIRSGGTRGLAAGLTSLRGLRNLVVHLDGTRSCSVAEDVGTMLCALRGIQTLSLSLQQTGLCDAEVARMAQGFRNARCRELIDLSLALDGNLLQGPGLQILADAVFAAAPVARLQAVRVTWTDNDVSPGVSAHLLSTFNRLGQPACYSESRPHESAQRASTSKTHGPR